MWEFTLCTLCTLCTHRKNKYYCKECGGKGICRYGMNKCYCKESGGKGLCIRVYPMAESDPSPRQNAESV